MKSVVDIPGGIDALSFLMLFNAFNSIGFWQEGHLALKTTYLSPKAVLFFYGGRGLSQSTGITLKKRTS